MRSSVLVALALAGLSHALPKISRVGKYLYDEDGKRFFIKGISYQEAGTLAEPEEEGDFPEPIDFVDPLALPDACSRDIEYLRALTVNTVRVYSVDASRNHDECMSTLAGAGIYTFIDLSLPVNGSITRREPTWTTNLLNLYLGTIDAFLKYDNVLGFNIGNEVVMNEVSTITAPFIKAAARDVKAYLASKGSSALVGYASTDGSDWRNELAHFLTCENEATSIDIWGLNNYRWCGADGSIDAYQESIEAFTDLPIPAYFSEFGCTETQPRTWKEVEAIFTNEDFSSVYSGGIAFSFYPTNDGFGITTIDGNTVTTSDEYTNLVNEYSKITSFLTTPGRDSATQPATPSCPELADGQWLASTTLPPTPNQNECSCTLDFFPCYFDPQAEDHTSVFEELFGQACTLLGENGGSCDSIGANGTTGVYGQFSSCDGATKLSHVFSQFYLATDLNPQSCDFAGNASINSAAPTDSSDIDSGIKACFSHDPDVFTPTEPTETPGIDTPSGGTTRSTGPRPTNTNTESSATSLMQQPRTATLFILVCALAAGFMLT